MKTISKIKNETFTIEKAINRLQWRFKNDKIKVNERNYQSGNCSNK